MAYVGGGKGMLLYDVGDGRHGDGKQGGSDGGGSGRST